jgi:type I restriction enzyme S subunit
MFGSGILEHRAAIPWEKLKCVMMPVPSPEEQDEIAKLTQRELGQIDTLVSKAKKAIELLKERRQALITQVVTGKIDVRGFAGGNS